MGECRAYIVGDDGHIRGLEPMVMDDGDSERPPRWLVGAYDVKLWEGKLLVVKLTKGSSAGS
jgi:hypothetical protein